MKKTNNFDNMSNHSKFSNKSVPKHVSFNKTQNRIDDTTNFRKSTVTTTNKMDIEDTIEISDSDSDSIRCGVCDESFFDKFNLHKHITISHPEISDVVFCDICNDSFINEGELRYHISIDHGSDQSKEQTLQQSSHNSKTKPKKLKQRRLYYLRKYLQMTNQLYGKFDNGSVMKKTQRRLARRKWLRKQLGLNKVVVKSSVNSDEETIDPDKSNLQYPTSTVEIEEYPEEAEYTNKIDKLIPLHKSEKCRNDSFNECDEKVEFSRETIADSSVSNQSVFNEFEDLSVENGSPVSTLKDRTLTIEESIELIDYDNDNNEEVINDGDADCGSENNITISDDSQKTSDSNIDKVDNINSTTSNEDLKKKIVNIDDKINNSSINKPLHRTYADKSFLQTVHKQVNKLKNNGEKNRVYCHMCNEIFSLMDQKCTAVTEDNKEITKCLFCNYKFTTKKTLEKHVAFSHLNCECIKNMKEVKTFSIPDKSYDQTEDKTNCTNFECSICFRTFVNYSKFNNHILSVHELYSPLKERLTIGKPEYLRRLSSTNFLCKSSSNDSLPIKNITNNKKVSIKCVSCQLILPTCAEYVRHIKQSHNDIRPIEESSWYPFKALNKEKITSSLRFFENLTGKNYLSDNTTEKNFHELRKTCKRCNREFDSIRELSKHFYLVHEDPSDSQTVTTTSTGERRTHDWYCLHCSQRFKLLQSYIRHRYFVHDDESMIHICDNCCKILTSIEMVNVHVCANVRFWTCKQCNESFDNSMALRLHNTEKHYAVPGPYICSTCEKKFLTKSMLLRHLQTKNCYSHSCPPEPSDIIENATVRIENLITSDDTINYLNIENKQNKELTNIKNFPNVEILQEDVLLRESTEEVGSPRLYYSPKSKKSEEDKIYQCSMCKLYFLSKSGLKLHINRAHTSAVEICQLCYRMYDSGNLVRHIIDKHLKSDKNNVHDGGMKDNDIEADTKELIESLGTKHLLALCEYQRHLELNFNHIACPRCSSAFETSEQYRLHNAQVHDKLCALCDFEFDTASDAVQHKSDTHGSIPCYVWYAHRIILAIGDTKTFEETAEKIIINKMTGNVAEENAIPLENNSFVDTDELNQDSEISLDEQDQIDQLDELDDDQNDEDEHEQKMILTIDPTVSVTPSDNDDELRLFLVVTEEDIDNYKHDLTQLARQISAACNIFSTEDIEKLLQLYLKDN